MSWLCIFDFVCIYTPKKITNQQKIFYIQIFTVLLILNSNVTNFCDDLVKKQTITKYLSYLLRVISYLHT